MKVLKNTTQKKKSLCCRNGFWVSSASSMGASCASGSTGPNSFTSVLLSLGYAYVYLDLCIDTSTGLYPIYLDIFAHAEFISSELTDRPVPAAEGLKTTASQTVQNTTPFLTVSEVLALVTADADPPLDVEAPATSSSDRSEYLMMRPTCRSHPVAQTK